MSWRPKDWDSQFAAHEIVKAMAGSKSAGDYLGRIFEAGADAMLEALQKEGESILKEHGIVNHIKTGGAVVFIPFQEEVPHGD